MEVAVKEVAVEAVALVMMNNLDLVTEFIIRMVSLMICLLNLRLVKTLIWNWSHNYQTFLKERILSGMVRVAR